MGVTVGEVQALLTARDAMSGVIENARATVGKLDQSLKDLNVTQSGVNMKDFSSGAGDAKASLTGLTAGAVATTGGVGELGSMLARVASVAAMGAFIKSAVEAGAHAQELANELQVDAQWLQKVGVAAKEGGGGIDDAKLSITYMQRAIAGGDGSVIQALTDMHLDLNALRQMQPQEMFMAIATAAKDMPNPIKQTDDVLTLLGRNAGVYLPAIRKGFKDVTDEASGMSSEAVGALDRLSNKIVSVYTGAKALAGETVGQLELVFEQLTGTGAFDIDAVREKIMAAPKALAVAATMSEDSLARIRKATEDLEVVFASAGRDGFQAQRIAAETLHELEVKDIEASVASAEEKHVRMIEEEKRYSADLYKIKTDEAKAVRDIQEASAAEIIARHGELLQAQLALELSVAALSRGNAESIGAAKLAITTRYAGEEYRAKEEALTALEQAEMIQADREISNAENKAAALLAIHEKYELQHKILAIQSESQLNTQIEALEVAHLARMAALGMTSAAQGAYSTLTPAQAAATAQHQAAVGGLEAAQKQALSLGDTDAAQRLQTLLDEEGAAFVRAMQEGGAAVTALAPKVESAGDRLSAALDRASGAANDAATVYTVVSGHLSADRFNSADGGRSAGEIYNDAIGNIPVAGIGTHFPARASGGQVSGGKPYLVGEHEPELFVPGADGSIVPSLRGGGGGVTVNVHNAGLLLSSDPRAMQQLASTISDVVSRSVKANRKLGTN